MKRALALIFLLLSFGLMGQIYYPGTESNVTNYGVGAGTAAPTASPTPTPSAIQAFNSSATPLITLASAQAGDCIIDFTYSNTNNNAGAATLGLSGMAGYGYGFAMGGGPPYGYIYLHQANPQDVATGFSGANTYEALTALGSFGVITAEAVRHSFCATDGFGTAATSASTTTLTVNNFTTTIGHDIGVILIGLQGNTNDISSCPANYSFLAAGHQAATGAHQGAAICINPDVGAAGAISPGNVTSTSGTGTGATVAFGLQAFTQSY